MVFKIGVDIGGTHTDAVLVDEKGALIESAKTLTTLQIEEGLEIVLRDLLGKACVSPQEIREVRIGTTHATNALLEAKSLLPIGVIRLTGKKEALIPAAFRWPEALAAYIVKTVAIEGGFECDGRERACLKNEVIDQAIETLIKAGASGIVIASSFSPLFNAHEKQIAKRIPTGTFFCCSSDVSGLGFIERENTAMLNLLLRNVLKDGFSCLRSALDRLEMKASLFLTHNEGSLMTLEEALERPILTLSSGQTNSFIGGARLTHMKEAVVIDIGGTTTDIGVIQKGFPRKTLGNIDIAGIPLNFPMPDVLSIAIGGGSIVNGDQIGPKSCGKSLLHQGVSFGGTILTLTDLALRAGAIDIKGAKPELVPLSQDEAKRRHLKAFMRIRDLARQIQASTHLSPIIVVGGGSFLFKELFEKAGFILPEHAAVANAFGSALAEIAETLDTTIQLSEEGVIEKLKEQIIKRVIEKGASPATVRLTQVEILPYHYLGGQRARVILSAAGEKHCDVS